jgi:hypothetical protein
MFAVLNFLSILFFSWTNIIGGSPLLLDTFKLQVNYKTIKTLAVDDNLPNVSIKNIHILQKDGREFDMEACISIVNKYRTSVETMVINDLELGFCEVDELLKNMENLQKLTLNDVKLISKFVYPLQLPKLTTLSITHRHTLRNMPARILEAFKFNSTIEELLIEFVSLSDSTTIIFCEFIETLPKIKHLKLKGQINNELLHSDLPHKLETLNINSLNTEDSVQFLLNRTELKELRLRWLPDVNSAAFVRTCYERLDTFYLEDTLLIRNFQPQHVEQKLKFVWEAGLEVLKRGRCEWNL